MCVQGRIQGLRDPPDSGVQLTPLHLQIVCCIRELEFFQRPYVAYAPGSKMAEGGWFDPLAMPTLDLFQGALDRP